MEKMQQGVFFSEQQWRRMLQNRWLVDGKPFAANPMRGLRPAGDSKTQTQRSSVERNNLSSAAASVGGTITIPSGSSHPGTAAETAPSGRGDDESVAVVAASPNPYIELNVRPTERRDYAVAVDLARTSLLLHGGTTSQGKKNAAQSGLFRYDCQAKRWDRLVARRQEEIRITREGATPGSRSSTLVRDVYDFGPARAFHVAGLWMENFIIHGGKNQHDQPTSDLLAFHFQRHIWEPLHSWLGGTPPPTMYGHAMVSFEHGFLLVGPCHVPNHGSGWTEAGSSPSGRKRPRDLGGAVAAAEDGSLDAEDGHSDSLSGSLPLGARMASILSASARSTAKPPRLPSQKKVKGSSSAAQASNEVMAIYVLELSESRWIRIDCDGRTMRDGDRRFFSLCTTTPISRVHRSQLQREGGGGLEDAEGVAAGAEDDGKPLTVDRDENYVVEGSVVLVGGRVGGRWLADIWRFDLQLNHWREVSIASVSYGLVPKGAKPPTPGLRASSPFGFDTQSGGRRSHGSTSINSTRWNPIQECWCEVESTCSDAESGGTQSGKLKSTGAPTHYLYVLSEETLAKVTLSGPFVGCCSAQCLVPPPGTQKIRRSFVAYGERFAPHLLHPPSSAGGRSTVPSASPTRLGSVSSIQAGGKENEGHEAAEPKSNGKRPAEEGESSWYTVVGMTADQSVHRALVHPAPVVLPESRRIEADILAKESAIGTSALKGGRKNGGEPGEGKRRGIHFEDSDDDEAQGDTDGHSELVAVARELHDGVDETALDTGLNVDTGSSKPNLRLPPLSAAKTSATKSTSFFSPDDDEEHVGDKDGATGDDFFL